MGGCSRASTVPFLRIPSGFVACGEAAACWGKGTATSVTMLRAFRRALKLLGEDLIENSKSPWARVDQARPEVEEKKILPPFLRLDRELCWKAVCQATTGREPPCYPEPYLNHGASHPLARSCATRTLDSGVS